jgi:hypothetical protein
MISTSKMKNRLQILLACIVIFIASCNKEENLAARIDGTWDVDKIDVYYWNDTTKTFIHNSTHNNAGTITLSNSDKNKNHTESIEECNMGALNVPGFFVEGKCYWCVLRGSKNSLKRLEIKDARGNTTSFTLDKTRIHSGIWIRTYNDTSSLDNEFMVKEVWELSNN